jgi:hypothetical protein
MPLRLPWKRLNVTFPSTDPGDREVLIDTGMW